MLIYGTCNPEPVSHDQSIYVTGPDMQDLIQQIDEAAVSGNHIPVKLEHKGIGIGRVISAWQNQQGEMQCILEVDDKKTLEGSFAKEFLNQGIVKDLSLGYDVTLEQSKTEKKTRVRRKLMREISMVKRGARSKCHILSYKY